MKKILLQMVIGIAALASTLFLVQSMRVHSLAFAWALNFLLMFWVFVFTETQTIAPNSSYYSLRQWEQQGKLYEYLGINLFRKILVWIGWEKLNKKSNPVEKNVQALQHNLLKTKKAEFGHLVIFLVVLAVTAYVILASSIRDAIWLIFFNILLNLYPVLLQRYNRPRIERAIQLMQKIEIRTKKRQLV